MNVDFPIDTGIVTKAPSRLPQLSIIIVNWNCGHVILDCIESLTRSVKDHTFEIIVVDNNSSDGSVQKIKKKYPGVRLIENKLNMFFAKACNQGYEHSYGEYILLLNPDTFAKKTSIDTLLDYALENGQDALTCTLLNFDGTVQYNLHRSFPTYFKLCAFFLSTISSRLRILRSAKTYLLLNNDFQEDFYVEQAACAALLLSRRLIMKLGMLFDDERFPLLYNDVDLCYRIYQLDEKILCKTDVQIYHLKSASLKKILFEKHLNEHIYSALRFFRKHKYLADYFLLKSTFMVMGPLITFISRLRQK